MMALYEYQKSDIRTNKGLTVGYSCFLFLQVAATKIQANYRGYSQRKRGKKEAHKSGDQVLPPVAEAESGHEAGTNTTHPDDGAKLSSSKMEGNKSDPPKQDPVKSGSAKKEDKKTEDPATKVANQSAVPQGKVEANHTPKQPSKETTKSTKKK